MKYLLVFFTLLSVRLLAQETKEYEIKGNLSSMETGTAYMVNLRTDSFFRKIPIVDQKFSYKGELPFQKENTIYGGFDKFIYLFIDKRDNITIDEIRSKIKNQLWVPGRDSNIKTVIMEDITLDISDVNDLKTTKIISGGDMTKLLEKSRQAHNDRKLPEFIKANPKSPLSLMQIESLLSLYRLPGSIAEQKFGNIKEMYDSLADNLKQTDWGKKVKQKIDEL